MLRQTQENTPQHYVPAMYGNLAVNISWIKGRAASLGVSWRLAGGSSVGSLCNLRKAWKGLGNSRTNNVFVETRSGPLGLTGFKSWRLFKKPCCVFCGGSMAHSIQECAVMTKRVLLWRFPGLRVMYTQFATSCRGVCWGIWCYSCIVNMRLCQTIYVSIYLASYQSVYQSINLSVCPSIYLSIH